MATRYKCTLTVIDNTLHMHVNTHADAYPTVSVRLVGGLSDADGRVEVNYQGTWGTVCNDTYWGFNDATVICRMLGYTAAVAAHVKYGQGTGTIWMSSLACTGSENSISECVHRGWGETTCYHFQDAGVTCGDGKCCWPLVNWNAILIFISYIILNLLHKLTEWHVRLPPQRFLPQGVRQSSHYFHASLPQ